MQGRFFSLPAIFLLLAAAGPAPMPGQPVILQGPIGTDIIPGTPYGAYPPGLEPRLPILPPAVAPMPAPQPFGSSPTGSMEGCAAYGQAYMRLDCENRLNRRDPAPVRVLENNPPLPPGAPSAAAVPPTVPIAPSVPLESKLVPGTITDPRSGRAIPPNQRIP